MAELSVVGFQPDWGGREWDKRRWGSDRREWKRVRRGKREKGTGVGMKRSSLHTQKLCVHVRLKDRKCIAPKIC